MLLLLLLTAVPWQSTATTALGTASFDSGTEKYKLAISGLAILAAAKWRARGIRWPTISWLLIGYAAVAVVAGAMGPDLHSSLFRSIRFVAVVVAVCWIAPHFDTDYLASLLVSFAFWISAISLSAYITGRSVSSDGRLGGFPIPLHPNMLGFIAGLGLLSLVFLAVEEHIPRIRVAYSAPILAVTLGLTGSRTSLGAFAVGLAVLLAPRLRRRGMSVVWLATSALVGTLIVQTSTSYHPLGSVLTRGGQSPVASALDSRFAAQRSVLDTADTTSAKLIGNGLAAKSVSVKLPYTSSAPVDNSFFAAYHSSGGLGVTLVLFAVIGAFFVVLRGDSIIGFGILTFVVISSLTATVLDDVSYGLVVLLALTAAIPRVRHRGASTAAN